MLVCSEVFGVQAGPINNTTQTELQALFDIIGTPHWADVEALQSPAWKKYLQRLPGKAPTLFRYLYPLSKPSVSSVPVLELRYSLLAGQAKLTVRPSLQAVAILLSHWFKIGAGDSSQRRAFLLRKHL